MTEKRRVYERRSRRPTNKGEAPLNLGGIVETADVHDLFALVVDTEGVVITDLNLNFRDPVATASLTGIIVNAISRDLDAEAVALQSDRDVVLVRHAPCESVRMADATGSL